MLCQQICLTSGNVVSTISYAPGVSLKLLILIQFQPNWWMISVDHGTAVYLEAKTVTITCR